MRYVKKILILAIIITFILGLGTSTVTYALEESSLDESSGILEDTFTYRDYLASNKNINATSSITIDHLNYDSISENVEVSGNNLVTYETSYVSWEFDALEEGYYNLKIGYYPSDGNGLSIQRKMLLDGESPFYEAELLTFHRLWVDATEIKNENGNEVRPSQVEAPTNVDYIISDESKINEGYLKFYLTQGTHTLTFVSVREPMDIYSLQFIPVQNVKTYEEVKKSYQGLEVVENVEYVKYQAEVGAVKSSSSLYATSDNTSPLTENYKGEKNHLYQIRLNLTGGSNWKSPGDFIEWTINVPKEGLYNLSLRYLQDLKSDLSSYRTLYINGEVPFKECESIEFEYTKKFVVKTFGDESGAWYFHLKEGENKIRLQVSLGKYAEAINEIKDIINRLNALYRRIIVVTGTTPDINVDYQLERVIPGIVDSFNREKENLIAINKIITDTEGKKTVETVALGKLIDQLDEFANNVYLVPKNLSLFSSNISSLGTCLNNLMTQPLKIDHLGYHSANTKLPKGKENFFQKLWFEFRKLIVSFFVDYDSLGSGTEGEVNIEVWVLTGRDQTQVIKNLVASDFSPNHNIGVTLKVVPGGALLPNVLVGQGPDAVLMVGNDTPVQYAFRNASYDLSTFEDFDEVIGNNYYESIITNLRYDGGVYGLPETISFPVLYYRKDIIVDQLGLDVPQTWDDMLDVMHELRNSNMDIYLGQPSNVNNTGIDSFFASLLYQNGGDFYHNHGEETALREEVAIRTFIDWTEYYTQYSIPLTANFVNRFRSGDMPIGISDYSLFNTLTMSAPEINGKWEMTLLPGTLKEDGSIDRSTISSGGACMMIKDTEHPEETWEFLKWWVSSKTQSSYGREIESILGVSARYTTANIEAMKEIPWSANEIKTILEQYSYVKGFEQVPGGYMTARQLNYAFRKVVNENTNPRETLLEYALTINDELTLKRKEFGLE